VNHLNWLEGTDYVHKVCLDVIDRNTPQPEALYVDDGSGARLVIERKNLVWPPEYAVGHKNDHFVVDLATQGLRDLISDDAYELELDLGVSGSRVELEEFADQIGQTVRARFPELRAGMRVGSTQAGRLGRSPVGTDTSELSRVSPKPGWVSTGTLLLQQTPGGSRPTDSSKR
jgi:hypothetical protein